MFYSGGSDTGVRQHTVIADYALLSSMKSGLAALDNLADKFVAGWLLPSKVLSTP